MYEVAIEEFNIRHQICFLPLLLDFTNPAIVAPPLPLNSTKLPAISVGVRLNATLLNIFQLLFFLPNCHRYQPISATWLHNLSNKLSPER